MGYAKAETAFPTKTVIWYTISSIVQKGVGMFLIPVYVHLMSTREYGAYTLFQSWEGIIMIFTTLNLAAYVFNNCLAKSELVVVASVFAAIVNVVLNYIFIPKYGYLAAGYTTLISYVCLAIVHAVIYKYTLKLEGINTPVYNLHKIAIFSASIIIIGILSIFLYQSCVARYIIVTVLFVLLFIKRKVVSALFAKTDSV